MGLEKERRNMSLEREDAQEDRGSLGWRDEHVQIIVQHLLYVQNCSRPLRSRREQNHDRALPLWN